MRERGFGRKQPHHILKRCDLERLAGFKHRKRLWKFFDYKKKNPDHFPDLLTLVAIADVLGYRLWPVRAENIDSG